MVHEIPLGAKVIVTEKPILNREKPREFKGVVVGHTLKTDGAYKCDYVVLVDKIDPDHHSIYNKKMYVDGGDLRRVQEIKAFAYVDLSGNIQWFCEECPRRGFIRRTEYDFSKEVEN